MNAAELPMILFTVLAQMSVGAFLTLGLIQVYGALRKDTSETVDRTTRAALFAVGPLLVLGFFAAFFHLNDPLHALNTFRHVGSSWLSREILFGVLYGALGFLYTALEWFRWTTRLVRQVVATLTALAGIGLLIAMTNVYYSVRTIPAWHTPATWLLFLGSTLLTGPLAVGVALLFTWTRQTVRDTEGADSAWARLLDALRLTVKEPMDVATSTLMARSIQLIAVISSVAGVVLLVTYPVQLLHLARGADAASDHVLASLTDGPALTWRLVILAVVVVLVRFVAYQRAKDSVRPSRGLVWTIAITYVLAVATELLGRAIHYEGLYHVGLNTLQTGLGG
ncbi:dimethyl sulfoxide reductase anchor subunit family protein [Actinomyces haliotis]|uniref:dimethyl sulfoxide reductase anchor subunit family protein n=1 Tax=Actinomyces haliotis TaxID=1280843 RepID=UPI0018901DEF|nr:DmsC/YnfH family molybdoenzyme membrane anchor subunit [Actinomyces haliotis]